MRFWSIFHRYKMLNHALLDSFDCRNSARCKNRCNLVLFPRAEQSEGAPQEAAGSKRDAFTQILPTQSSLPVAVSMDSQHSEGRAVIAVLPESTRSNLAQLVSERGQLYAEISNVLGQETSAMHARSEVLRAQAEVVSLKMRVALLQGELAKHGLSAPESTEESEPVEAVKVPEVPVAEGSTDVYTVSIPKQTEEEKLESDRLQAEYAAEAAALAEAETSLSDVPQVRFLVFFGRESTLGFPRSTELLNSNTNESLPGCEGCLLWVMRSGADAVDQVEPCRAYQGAQQPVQRPCGYMGQAYRT
jgi:hypothetical protein